MKEAMSTSQSLDELGADARQGQFLAYIHQYTW